MSKNSEANVAEFFTGNANDNRGQIFLKLAMNPSDILFGVQTPRTWEEVRSFISVVNFNEKPKPKAREQYYDEDVHWEIYQFIEDVAKWHKFINMSTKDAAQIIGRTPRARTTIQLQKDQAARRQQLQQQAAQQAAQAEQQRAEQQRADATRQAEARKRYEAAQAQTQTREREQYKANLVAAEQKRVATANRKQEKEEKSYASEQKYLARKRDEAEAESERRQAAELAEARQAEAAEQAAQRELPYKTFVEKQATAVEHVAEQAAKRNAAAERELAEQRQVFDELYGGAYLGDPELRSWYLRTIAKMNYMPLYVKNLYNAFFNMVGPNEQQLNLDSPIVQGQFGKYRINLKKTNENDYLFEKALPHITQKTRVWTSQNEFITPGDEEYFEILYKNIVNGSTPNRHWNPSTNAKEFNINDDKLVQELLRQSLEIQMPTFEDISNDDDIIINNKYAARDSAHNLIWKKDGVNNINAKQAFDTLTADKCYTSSINATPEQCQNFIQQCILSDSDAACQKAFATQKLFSNIDKESIKNIHPYIAYKILQKLQFYGIKKFDKTANRDLIKVIDANTWGQEVAPKISFVKTVSDKQKLIEYLQLLVDYCNSNPAIFNNDYSGETQEAFNYPEIQDPYGLKTPLVDITRSINDTSFVPITSNISRLNQRLKFIVRQPILSRVAPMQFMAGPQLSPPMSVMIGGGNVIPQYYTAMYAKHSGALALRSVYIRNLERLQRYNKDLSVESKAKIVSLLEELYETEVKVLKYINLIEKYNSLSDLFPNSQEKMFNPKLLDKITQKYETMLQKKERRENTIMDVLETLVKSVKEQTPETVERVSLPNPIANTEF